MLWLLLGGLLACGIQNLDNIPSVEEFIANIKSNPSDQFIIGNFSTTNSVSSTTSYVGTNGGECNHEGAHLSFKDQGADYTVEIVAPQDGYVTYIRPCKENRTHDETVSPDGNDAYDIWFRMADNGSGFSREFVELELSIEPMKGIFCSGRDGSAVDEEYFVNAGYIDSNLYESYNKNDAPGLFFKKSEVIGKMLVPAGSMDATHIHYNLRVKKKGEDEYKACPNLFTSAIESTQMSYRQTESNQCGQDLTPYSFCAFPGDGEDLFK